MKPSVSVLGLIATLALVPFALPAAHAQANDMFPTKAAAEKRAKELKCKGAFAMGREWMPCDSFATYEKAVQKES